MKFVVCVAAVTVLGVAWILKAEAPPAPVRDEAAISALAERVTQLGQSVARLERTALLPEASVHQPLVAVAAAPPVEPAPAAA